MKISAVLLTALSLLLALPLAQAQEGAAQVTAQKVSFSQPQLEKFAEAYRQIVILSREYAPKLKAAADIEEAEALNKEAQGKMLKAIQGTGLSKDEYQQIASGLKSDPSLVEKVNKILQKKADAQ